MWHGCQLEPPVSSSTRDPQFATRSMGVVDTSPLRPAKEWRRGVLTSQRAHPDRLEWAQARGLDARLHLLDMHRTQANAETCAWHRRGRLKYCRGQLKQTPRTLETCCGKTLHEYSHSSKDSGATPVGALVRPHGTSQHPGGKKVLSESTNLCGFLTDTAAKARGLLSGTAIRVP
jgi:hypothetical protein